VRALGIVRVSQVAGREGESFASPAEQRERIQAACERDGLELVETIDELDVSGGTPLERREGLKRAVESVEAGAAEVIVAAYFDRLVRSLRVQDEVVSRVEAAGGRVLALDFGEVSGATAAHWLSGTMIGAVSEYHRRAVRERSGAAQARAVARGVAPWPNIPPGYERGPEGVLRPSRDAPAVLDAFRMRAAGETIKDIRAFLSDLGVDRSYHGIQSMLTSRVYLGEIHFGKLVNLEAHEPIVDPVTWKAAQRPPRGLRSTSDRLLSRLGVLRCGTCGSRMVVGTAHQGRYPFYRCPPTGDCPKRVTIAAGIAETVVIDAVLAAYSDAEGRASAHQSAVDAAERAERAQADLDAAIRTFAGLEDEASAKTRLQDLRAARDQAVEEAEQLGHRRSAVTLNLARDWDRLTMTERRAIIQATVEVAVVGQGRGPERITVVLR
jgi:DNA invertase Pin-like site-specific DNA recombinase